MSRIGSTRICPMTNLNDKHRRVRDLLLDHRPEQSRDFWPWLGAFEGQRADKKSANKFLLGCMVDFRKNSDRVWRDTRIFAERMLCDPEDLWDAITDTPEIEWKTRGHKLRCSLHYYQRRHDKVWDMAKRIAEKYGGDARNIWEGCSTEATLTKLLRLGLGPWVSRMTVGGLIDTGQISGQMGLKADTHVRRVLGRVFAGEKVSEKMAFRYGDSMIPSNSWLLDHSLFILGQKICTSRKPKCHSCYLDAECRYFGGDAGE